LIGILIFPWKLIADPSGYIFKWLIAYSSLLGPIGGIMITDYYFIRKQELIVNDLYNQKGLYGFSKGINSKAIIALLIGIIPNVPGFLVNVNIVAADSMPVWLSQLYNYAWFVGFGVSGFIYWLLMKKK